MTNADQTIHDVTSPPCYKVLLRWFPNVNQSAVFDKIGIGWKCDDGGTIHMRFLVLGSVMNAVMEKAPSETLLPESGILKFFSNAEQEERPSHVVKLANIIIGFGWEQKVNPGLDVRLFVMGQIVNLVIAKV
jgi:hypothetical protein